MDVDHIILGRDGYMT